MKTPGARLRRLVVGCEAPHPTCTDVVDSRQNPLPGMCSSTTACGAKLLVAFCLCMACGDTGRTPGGVSKLRCRLLLVRLAVKSSSSEGVAAAARSRQGGGGVTLDRN